MKGDTKLDFGDYCSIEQKRYGCQNEFYTYKVIGRLNSNTYRQVPVDARTPDNIITKEMHEIVRVICCGVAEDKVERFRIVDVIPINKCINTQQPNRGE